MNTRALITYGFISAGIANILGMLWLSKGGTDIDLSANVPVLFHGWGMLCVVLWGLAYIAVARNYHSVRALIWVFALEKLVYVVSWCVWMYQQSGTLPYLLKNDIFEGAFMLIYGSNDALFMLFFICVAVGRNHSQSQSKTVK